MTHLRGAKYVHNSTYHRYTGLARVTTNQTVLACKAWPICGGACIFLRVTCVSVRPSAIPTSRPWASLSTGTIQTNQGRLTINKGVMISKTKLYMK